MPGRASRWGIRSVASRHATAGIALGAAFLVASFAVRAVAAWTPTSPEACPGRPEDPAAARTLAGEMFTRGAERAAAGDDDEAVALYACSYSIAPHPNTLYNLALAQEAAGRPADACIVLELYLREAADAIDRPRAEELLAELRCLVEESDDTPPGPSPPPPPPPPRSFRPFRPRTSPAGKRTDGGVPTWHWPAGFCSAPARRLPQAALPSPCSPHRRVIVLDPDRARCGATLRRQDVRALPGLGRPSFSGVPPRPSVGPAARDLGASESPPVLIAMPLIGPGMVGLSWSGSFDAF